MYIYTLYICIHIYIYIYTRSLGFSVKASKGIGEHIIEGLYAVGIVFPWSLLTT